MEAVAHALVLAAGIYLACGVLFAIPFVLAGVRRIDPAAHDAGWGFRLIVLPGVVAFWPLLAARWVKGAPPPTERNAHRAAARTGGSR
jgi:hypothetical protein